MNEKQRPSFQEKDIRLVDSSPQQIGDLGLFMEQYPSILESLKEAKNTDIETFFERLRQNAPLGSIVESWKSLPNVGDFIEDYYNFFAQSGELNNLITYARFRNSTHDPLNSEDAVSLSIWRSLYAYPWNEGFSKNRIRAYLYTFINIQLSKHPESRTVSYDLIESDNQLGDILPENIKKYTSLPEAGILEKDELNDLVDALLAESDKRSHTTWRRPALYLLAEGMSTREISTILRINESHLQQFIKYVRETTPVDRSDRIDSNANGVWRWTEHTAATILKDPYLVSLLREKEILFLNRVLEGYTYENFRENGEKELYDNMSDSIRFKIRYNGKVTKDSDISRASVQTDLLYFISYISPTGEFETNIVSALQQSKGNIDQAARILGTNRSVIYTFLKRRGYYEIR